MPLCANGSVPLHDLAYPKDAQKNIATPDKEVHLVRIHLEEDVAKSFHFETTHRDRLQPRRHAADGNRDPTGDQFAGGSVRVSHLAQTNPDLRQRQRCRHGERSAALRLQRFGAAGEAGRARGQDRDQEHEFDQRRAARAGLTRFSDKSTRSSAAKSSSRKRAAGTTRPAKHFSCAQKNRRTIIVIFPIPIWCR